MRFGLSILCVVVLGVARPTAAQEIRVLDPHGLTRAVQPSLEPMTVEVAVGPAANGMLGGATLVQNSGLVEDKAAAGEDGRYLFPAIPPGTWQVKLIEPNERVRSIRIVK